MKFNLHNQRRCQREGAPNISLFPFLAVLICTMGALVPLLFAITRQARLQAAQTAVSKIAERKAEIKTEHETMQWRIEQLRTSRTKTNAQVADARLELGHLEDHSRELREKFSVLERTVTDLDKLDSDDNRQRSEQVEDLNKLHAQIDVAKKQVNEAQLDAASRKKSYAIVPYEGPNQTYRRPIYLECRADAVVLQPEGIEFLETDFEGPLGPGNPLAAALRAVREYLLANHGFDPQRDGEPYPLLLVRPDGISAYYAARAAMTSWATEFGYELIEADWKLAYQPPDVQLTKVVQEVLVSARCAQQRLIAAAPGAYSKKPKATYRASPSRGGSVQVGGSAYNDEDVEDSGFHLRQPSGRIGRGYGSSGAGPGGDNLPGPTEAERVASLYGSAGGGTSSQGGPYPTGQSTGGQFSSGQGGIPGNSYGPALGGGMGGNVAQQGAAGGGYGTGSGTLGGGNGTAGAGGGTIVGGNGTIGGRNPTGGYGDGSDGPGGAGSEPGTGNTNAVLTGQGTSTGGSVAYGGMESSTQSSGSAGRNLGNAGYASGNSGYGGGAGNSGDFGGIAGGRTGNSGNANNNLGGNGSTSGNGTGSSSGGGEGVGGGGISGDGSSQATAGQGTSKGSATYPEGYIPGDRGQGTGNKGSSGQIGSAEGYIVGQPPTEKNLPDQKTQEASNHAVADQGNGVPVMPLRPGEWRETVKPPPIKPEDEKPDEKKNGKHAKSLASKRGQDWALPDAAHGSVPVTRPIRVECRADQLIIVPEAGLSDGKTVPLGTRTEASTEAFISAVWEHMETWGIAGRGMYWRPILNIYVVPGGEQRFADLQMLMEGSGLKIVRK